VLKFNMQRVLSDPTGEQDRPLVVRRANMRKPATALMMGAAGLQAGLSGSGFAYSGIGQGQAPMPPPQGHMHSSPPTLDLQQQQQGGMGLGFGSSDSAYYLQPQVMTLQVG
jgi:hypothetical protein